MSFDFDVQSQNVGHTSKGVRLSRLITTVIKLSGSNTLICHHYKAGQ